MGLGKFKCCCWHGKGNSTTPEFVCERCPKHPTNWVTGYRCYVHQFGDVSDGDHILNSEFGAEYDDRIPPASVPDESYILFNGKPRKQPKPSQIKSVQTERRKARLLERDGPGCYLCGRTDMSYESLEIEHKIPKSRGGNNSLHNLGLADSVCNRAKGAMTVKEYKETPMYKRRRVDGTYA